MPLYQYICETCGSFEETAPISQYAEPCDCPTCGAISPRNLLSVPQLSTLNPQARKAHGVNERAADSPRRANANGLTPSGPRINSRALTRKDGSKSMPGARPWMLSH
ncbi:MAG: zinc ribbon domain-containing protein [Pseudomonadota bacterium]